MGILPGNWLKTLKWMMSGQMEVYVCLKSSNEKLIYP